MTPLPATAAAAQLSRPAAPVTPRSGDPEAARKTATEFEAMFLSQMLEHMFKGVPTDGLFGGGQSEGVWRSMLLQHYARSIADRGGIGIADMVSREMLALQEAR